MQLISTLALAASASALVAPVAPKASTALKGATLDDQLKKIPGVSPLKNAPADYGFDPLGFAKVSYPRFGLPDDELLRTNNLRDAELRHGRLAMLAAAAWPIQELAHPSLAKLAGAPELLSDGRSPSILNGGLVAGPVPAFLLATAAAIGYLDVQAEAKKAEYPAVDWIPGLGAVSLEMPYISPERHRRGAQMLSMSAQVLRLRSTQHRRRHEPPRDQEHAGAPRSPKHTPRRRRASSTPSARRPRK